MTHGTINCRAKPELVGANESTPRPYIVLSLSRHHRNRYQLALHQEHRAAAMVYPYRTMRPEIMRLRAPLEPPPLAGHSQRPRRPTAAVISDDWRAVVCPIALPTSSYCATEGSR